MVLLYILGSDDQGADELDEIEYCHTDTIQADTVSKTKYYCKNMLTL